MALRVLIAAGLALTVWLFAAVQTTVIISDPMMYGTAAALLPQYPLYIELPFLQMPLVAWLQGLVIALVGLHQAHTVLLVASTLLTLCALGLLAAFMPRIQGVRALALLALIGTSAALWTAWGNGNHGLQLFLAALLLLSLMHKTPSIKTAAGVGGLLGLLVLTKLNSLPLVLPVLVWLWDAQKRGRCLIAVCLAGLVTMAPFLWLLWQHPAEVWFNVVTANTLNNDVRAEGWSTSLMQLVVLLKGSFSSPALVTLAILAVLPLLAWWQRLVPDWREAETRQSPERRTIHLLVIFSAAGLMAALLPGKLYPYHLALLVAPLVLLLAAVVAAHRVGPLYLQIVTIAALALTIKALLSLAMVEPVWGPARDLAAIRTAYGATIDKVKSAEKLCTTEIFSSSALPLLGGPLDVLPASSAGPFLLRLGNLPPKQFQRWSDPAQILGNRPALLTGFNITADEGLVAEARRLGYQSWGLGYYNAEGSYGLREWQLWLPPCGGAPE